jgi:hypothetical protein
MKKLYFLLILLINKHNVLAILEETPVGALVSVGFTGLVGFNLDEIPSYLMDESLDFIFNKVNDAQWKQRAIMQISATTNFQVFGSERQLTIPPKPLWQIELTSEAFKIKIENHQYVARMYHFNSMLVGPANGLNASQPMLTEIGGTFIQSFTVPIDPEHLLQRTGFACSFNSPTVNSENILNTFNQNAPECIQTLIEKVGHTNLDIVWQRIEWDENIANVWRYGEISQFADLEGKLDGLNNDINIGYRFIEENSCVLEEGGSGYNHGCVRGKGWRQLLKFSSVTMNKGRTEIHLGNISAEYVERGVFEFDPCHKHFHFQHYANFSFGNVPARKTGFCLQSTWRSNNNEWSTFNTPYSRCDFQGISPGWSDEYWQGLDCQWIDVTHLHPSNYKLKVVVNPDDFICEGLPMLDPKTGQLAWVETDFRSSSNHTVYREACKYTHNYKKNNNLQTLVHFHGINTIVTLPCKRHEILSPVKDCGFEVQYDNLRCHPNTKSHIKILNRGPTHAIVRLCETSHVLGHTIACEYVDALVNEQIKPGKYFQVFEQKQKYNFK